MREMLGAGKVKVKEDRKGTGKVVKEVVVREARGRVVQMIGALARGLNLVVSFELEVEAVMLAKTELKVYTYRSCTVSLKRSQKTL